LHPGASSARRRVAFYSHDTLGLGHTRRNLRIAAALVSAWPSTEVLVLTGAPEATVLPRPPATEVLTLPTLRKHPDGHYSPRVLCEPLPEVLRLRSRLIETALTTFVPDLLIVDKVARGVGGELDHALRGLRRLGRSRVVLGLRDVLDAPEAARREWQQAHTTATLRRLYDAVWVYGDPRVYDLVHEYALPESVAKITSYTGYLAKSPPECLRVRHPVTTPTAPPDRPFVLCLVGGGEDGQALADAFVHAPLPEGHAGVLLTGPHMPLRHRERLRNETRRRSDLTMHEFVAGAQDFVERAAAAVSMGGYNSVCELLAARCPTLLVPRSTPRAEQAVRAERLAAIGWVDVLPVVGATPGQIGEWLLRAVRRRPRPRRPIDLDGLRCIPQLADRLVAPTFPAEVPGVAV
jgi:predicted glycosyltransferase